MRLEAVKSGVYNQTGGVGNGWGEEEGCKCVCWGGCGGGDGGEEEDIYTIRTKHTNIPTSFGRIMQRRITPFI